MRRLPALVGPLGTGLLLAALLTGCASEQEKYCDEVVAQQDELSETAASGAQDGLIRALPSLRALQEKAPTDIRDEWDVVVGTIEELEAVLDDAGLDPATYDVKDLPDDVTEEQRTAVESAASELGSVEMVTALRGVEQQVRDVCHTPLAL